MLIPHEQRTTSDAIYACPATHTQNIWHRRKFKAYSRSKYKGVDFANDMNRWRARIRVNGKRIYLGSFKDEIEAARAGVYPPF